MSRDPQHLLDGGELAEWAGGQVRGQDVEPRGNAEGQAVLALNMVRSKSTYKVSIHSPPYQPSLLTVYNVPTLSGEIMADAMAVAKQL